MMAFLLVVESLALGVLALGVKANGLDLSRVFKDGLLKAKSYFKQAE